jgi:hypothetical protein
MRPSVVFFLLFIVSTMGYAQAKSPSAATDGKEKAKQAKALLNDSKRSLMKERKYNCCIKDDCDRCALDHQNCDCAADVKAGKSVCSDCYAGWQRGDGVVPDVKASQVKMGTHSHKH